MRNPETAAHRLLDSYSQSAGLVCPVQDARELMDRVTVDSLSNRWLPSRSCDDAESILERACFDVDDVAENHLGIDLAIQPLRHLDNKAGSPVFGCAILPQRRIIICTRTLEYEPLYRTTVMHEVGHIVVHGSAAPAQLNYSPGSRNRPVREREADLFMCMVLLPDPILDLAIAWASTTWELNYRSVTASANNKWGWDVWRRRMFPSLINKLCVSRQMLAYRMRDWGWFNQETVEYHQTYALPNRWQHRPSSGLGFARPGGHALGRACRSIVDSYFEDA